MTRADKLERMIRILLINLIMRLRIRHYTFESSLNIIVITKRFPNPFMMTQRKVNRTRMEKEREFSFQRRSL